VALAREAERVGCGGLMVLPPYVYASDWREMKAHVAAVLGATGLPTMLYNNPPAYKTDFLPEQVAELAAEFPLLTGVKESSGDARRVTALKAALPERVAVGVGLDDMLVEGVSSGASFWVAGLVNALPEESVALFDGALAGGPAAVRELYQWFLPLLRLDTGPKFVQLIKLVEARLGVGHERVRPPRLELVGAEREAALAVIDKALSSRPTFSGGGR
jgi:1-pyrroline-4-hydroxy-2-carboxylate deaminase